MKVSSEDLLDIIKNLPDGRKERIRHGFMFRVPILEPIKIHRSFLPDRNIECKELVFTWDQTAEDWTLEL